jgi:hypothetical protein
MAQVNEADPPWVFVALITYVAWGVITFGVPEIAPVELLKLNPLGSEGKIWNDVAPAAGLTVGVRVVIPTPCVKISTAFEYAIDICSTAMVIVIVAEPPVLVARITIDEELYTAVGVPDITPLVEFSDNPCGITPEYTE